MLLHYMLWKKGFIRRRLRILKHVFRLDTFFSMLTKRLLKGPAHGQNVFIKTYISFLGHINSSSKTHKSNVFALLTYITHAITFFGMCYVIEPSYTFKKILMCPLRIWILCFPQLGYVVRVKVLGRGRRWRRDFFLFAGAFQICTGPKNRFILLLSSGFFWVMGLYEQA